MLLIMK